MIIAAYRYEIRDQNGTPVEAGYAVSPELARMICSKKHDREAWRCSIVVSPVEVDTQTGDYWKV